MSIWLGFAKISPIMEPGLFSRMHYIKRNKGKLGDAAINFKKVAIEISRFAEKINLFKTKPKHTESLKMDLTLFMLPLSDWTLFNWAALCGSCLLLFVLTLALRIWCYPVTFQTLEWGPSIFIYRYHIGPFKTLGVTIDKFQDDFSENKGKETIAKHLKVKDPSQITVLDAGIYFDDPKVNTSPPQSNRPLLLPRVAPPRAPHASPPFPPSPPKKKQKNQKNRKSPKMRCVRG